MAYVMVLFVCIPNLRERIKNSKHNEWCGRYDSIAIEEVGSSPNTQRIHKPSARRTRTKKQKKKFYWENVATANPKRICKEFQSVRWSRSKWRIAFTCMWCVYNKCIAAFAVVVRFTLYVYCTSAHQINRKATITSNQSAEKKNETDTQALRNEICRTHFKTAGRNRRSRTKRKKICTKVQQQSNSRRKWHGWARQRKIATKEFYSIWWDHSLTCALPWSGDRLRKDTDASVCHTDNRASAQ